MYQKQKLNEHTFNLNEVYLCVFLFFFKTD